MKYSLIVDLGNSQTELAVFDENNLIDKIRFETDKINSDYDNRKIKQFLSHLGIDGKDFEGGMIFSVVPHLTRLVQIILKGEIGIDIKAFDPKPVLASLKHDVDDPNEIGQDLLADIVGALHYYGAPVVVSDLGTVSKNLIIDKDGVFQGVSFFPGIRMNANILSDMTAQLPVIKEVTKPDNYYGKNTIDAMRCGVYYCHLASIRRFMDRTEEEFGYKFKRVVTGGNSYLLADEFKGTAIVDQTLVLKGMHLIYKMQK